VKNTCSIFCENQHFSRKPAFFAKNT
jgi:hypothetical protein